MATAICAGCSQEVRWYAGRGRPLADLRCPGCGGALHGKTAGQASRSQGQHFAKCDHCGRRRLERKFTVLPQALWLSGPSPSELPVGARVCGWHHLAVPGTVAYAHRPGGCMLVSVSEFLKGVVCESYTLIGAA